MKVMILILSFSCIVAVADEKSSSSKVQLLQFEGSTLEGKEMRPSIELVVDPGEVFGEAVFIEPLELKKISERTISESLLEDIQ